MADRPTPGDPAGWTHRPATEDERAFREAFDEARSTLRGTALTMERTAEAMTHSAELLREIAAWGEEPPS